MASTLGFFDIRINHVKCGRINLHYIFSHFDYTIPIKVVLIFTLYFCLTDCVTSRFEAIDPFQYLEFFLVRLT